MKGNHIKGKKAEDIAAGLLENKGYTILDRNWRHIHKELDIVALDKDVLVIVEVKSRFALNNDPLSELVSPAQQKHIVDAAEAYIFKNDIIHGVRFDIISVIFKGDNYVTNHIKDAFFPGINW